MKRRTNIERFIDRMYKTRKNKLYAMLLAGAGFWTLSMGEDGTAFVLTLFFAVPLFFANEEWIC